MRQRKVFLALVMAGLWEKEVWIESNDNIDYAKILRLAEQHSVVGLVTAGLERLHTKKLPLTEKLKFVGISHLIEQKNVAMNQFIATLLCKMQDADISALLVKGQGVAQCYEKPKWRTSGDVDLLLDALNYNKAKALLIPMADKVRKENVWAKHLAIEIKGFDVELHGRMPFEPSRKVATRLDDVILNTFNGDNLRIWRNNDIDIFLPNANDDVVIVFTHFLQHFFIEGVGLKQICDWCRLLWTFRAEIDRLLLESRLRSMGLMTEWKAFAYLAVNSLGMSEDAMPFYDKRYRRRGKMVLSHILKSGDLDHNKNVSYRSKYAKSISNTITFFRRMSDFAKFTFIFPVDSPKFFATYVLGKFKKNAA